MEENYGITVISTCRQAWVQSAGRMLADRLQSSSDIEPLVFHGEVQRFGRLWALGHLERRT
eukprot:2584159-Amphidinium_carterae.1